MKKVLEKNTKVYTINKTSFPTSNSGATSLSPLKDSFMYIERSANDCRANVFFCTFERTNVFQKRSFRFYCTRFLAGSSKSMGRFRIQLLLSDNTGNTRYNKPKN